MANTLAGKVALVTGGSRGIGAATARLAGLQGYRVVVNYQSNADAALGLVAQLQIGGNGPGVKRQKHHRTTERGQYLDHGRPVSPQRTQEL